MCVCVCMCVCVRGGGGLVGDTRYRLWRKPVQSLTARLGGRMVMEVVVAVQVRAVSDGKIIVKI